MNDAEPTPNEGTLTVDVQVRYPDAAPSEDATLNVREAGDVPADPR